MQTEDVRTPDPATIVAAVPDILFAVDAQGRLVYANHVAEVVLEWQAADWLGRSALDLVHPDDLAHVLSSLSTIQGKERGTPIEVRVLAGDGSWRWLELVGSSTVGADGTPLVLLVGRDLTRRRMWEVASDDVVRFQQVVQHAAAVVLLLRPDGTIDAVNGAFTRLLGHDPSALIGESLWTFAASEAAERLQDAVRKATRSSTTVAVEVAMERAAGAGHRPLRFELVNLTDDPVVGGIVVTGHDVSELQAAREELEHLATHDALTGLPNRNVLLERLSAAVALQRAVAVLYVDLDRFKPVNDLLGHDAGDELLCSVADRLRRQVRAGDLVARVGGDEFVVLTEHLDRRGVQVLAARLESALAEPFLLRAGPVRIGASVGCSTNEAGERTTVAGLLADADGAMYDVKAARRGETRRAHPNGTEGRRALVEQLASGLERGEVIAHFQPILDLAAGRVVSFEALARWNHPIRGVLSPGAFLALAEDAGLDVPLGDAVLVSACELLARTTDPTTSVSVNLSVAQLSDPLLCDRVEALLRRSGVAPHRLHAEITERAALGRAPGTGFAAPEATVRSLHAMGVSIVLDDFGTGYSSLTHVRRFPLSALKIDGSFVAGVVAGGQDRAIVAAVIGIAKALGLTAVAEGVESEAQREALLALGCDRAQGHLFWPALPGDAALGLLDAAPTRA